MLNFALLVAAKDLRIILARGGGPAQALLLGLLVLFVFSLSYAPGQTASAQEAAALFWLSSTFFQILIFNMLYNLEENNGAREALLLVPAPIQGIWLGKSLAALGLLFMAQAIFLPAAIVFLGQNPEGSYKIGLLSLLITDLGICALGSLLGALGNGLSGRDSLLSIILFPLLIPLLLSAIGVGASVFGAEGINVTSWLGIGAAFDAIFFGAGLLLFGFLYGEEG